MRNVSYSMGVSLDGFVVGPDGTFDWTDPDEGLFRHLIGEIQGVGVHLLGRKLYEAMLVWESSDEELGLDEAYREWAAIWRKLPKVVFSTTLGSVQGNARLATGSLAHEIEQLRSQPGEGSIAIGGATLAREAAELGLIDEYFVRLCPVLVGGGLPYFAHDGRTVDLSLLESRAFGSGVVFVHYRVKR